MHSMAETLFTCTNIYGQSYYPYRGMVPKNKSGWQKDGIDNGKTALVVDDQKNIDILYTDASGKVASAKNDGAEIINLSEKKSSIVIVVSYPNNTLESYYFFETKEKKYEMIMQQTKYGTMIEKSSTFRGECK